MDQNRSTFDIREGMDIIGSDGEKIGSVDHFEGDSIVVKGGLFSGDQLIPISSVAQADANQAYLNVTKDAAQNGQWLSETETTMGTSSAMGTDQTLGTTGSTYADTATSETMERDQQPFQHEQDSPRTHVNESDDLRVDLAEEELSARTREVDRGEVRVDKTVVSEEQTLDVPVTEERVNVSRRSVDRDVAAGDTAFEGGTIEVPVRGEEVDVRKDARVTEEIDISKDAVQETERVTDTVRREEVQIDESGANAGNASKSNNRGGKRNS